MPRPTLRHVALRAGVSVSTVSRVLNGSDDYHPDTVARVRAAAAELKYRPNAMARATRVGHGILVGALVDRERTRATELAPRVFWLLFLDELIDCLCAQGAGLVAVSIGDPELARRLPLDAAILVSPEVPEPLIDGLIGLPVTGYGTDERLAVAAQHDLLAATADVLDHLAQLGAARPALLLSEAEPALARGFETAYTSLQGDSGQPVLTAGFTDSESLATALVDLTARGMDALFVVGGTTAAVVTALREARVDVPLVVQSEGLVESAMAPPVTTLGLCARDSAHLVAEALLAALEDGVRREVTLPHLLQAPRGPRRPVLGTRHEPVERT